MLGFKLNHVSKMGHWGKIRGSLSYTINNMAAEDLGDGRSQGISTHRTWIIWSNLNQYQECCCHQQSWYWSKLLQHDDVSEWKHFPRYWPFVQGIHWSPVNSPDKGQWRGALIFSLICDWINSWVNNCEAGDLRCHQAHYDVTVMIIQAPHERG